MPSITLLPDNTSTRIENIYCIGRNYAKHIDELGNTAGEKPVVFLKPTSSVINDGGSIHLPEYSRNVHHEVEVVVLIGKSGRNIARVHAASFVHALAVGLDLTARDVQDELKSKGLPWAIAKGFDCSACLSSFLPKERFQNPSDIRFSLSVNGTLRQQGHTAMMLYPIDVIIEYLSSIFTLQEGDLIFTGTPEGVGVISSGDRLTLTMDGDLTASFFVA